MLKALQVKLGQTEQNTVVASPGLITEEYVSESSSDDDSSEEVTSTEEGSYTSSSQITNDLTYGGIVEEDWGKEKKFSWEREEIRERSEN